MPYHSANLAGGKADGIMPQSLTPPPTFLLDTVPLFLFPSPPSPVGEGDLSRDRLVFHSAQLMCFYYHHYLGQRRLHPVGSFMVKGAAPDFCWFLLNILSFRYTDLKSVQSSYWRIERGRSKVTARKLRSKLKRPLHDIELQERTCKQ